jgi:MFS transporter, DHA2 family, multidrug resistance protein
MTVHGKGRQAAREGAAQPQEYADPLRWHILAACCLVGFAKLAEPRLYMIGLKIPASAFETAWRDYQVLTHLGVVLFVACQLLGGVLGDLYGRRRVFLIGAFGFTAGNLLSLLAPNLPVLVGVRAVMGTMGALVFPLTLGLIRVTFEGRERSNALLIYTMSTSLGSLASLAAVPIEALFGWRVALVLPVAAGSAGALLAYRYLPESRARGGIGRAEAVIASAWTLSFLLVIFGLALAGARGTWRNPGTLAAGGAGLLGLMILSLWPRLTIRINERNAAQPPPRHFLSLLLLVSATLSFALSGFTLRLYGFFTTVQQFPALLGGLALAPILLGTALVLPWAANIAFRQPPRLVVCFSLGAMGVAMALTALARPTTPYLWLAPAMMLFGLGFLLASTVWNNIFLSALPSDLVGVSSGISKAAGLTGGALAGVVLGAVAQQVGLNDFARRIGAMGLTSEQEERALDALNTVLQQGVTGVEGDPLVIAQLTLLSVYREAYSVGIAAALLAAGVLCLLTSAIAWLWLRPEPTLVRPAEVMVPEN